MKAVYFAFVVLALIACALAGGDVKIPSLIQPLSAGVPNMCTHPADPGTLCASKPKSNRFAYNIGSHQCVEFMFNGCGGNPNNFDTLYECRKTCEIQNRNAK